MIGVVWIIPAVLFSLGNLFKFGFLGSEVKLNWLDIFVITIYLIFAYQYFFQIAEIVQNSKIARKIILFYVVGLLSLFLHASVFGIHAFLVGFLYWGRGLAYYLLFIPLSFLLSSNSLKKLLFAMGLAIVVTGLGQYLIFPDIRALAAAGWDPHYYRVVGTLLDPGFTGAILCGFLLLLIYFRDKFTRLKFWLMIAAVYLPFALTYSRSSYLAFIAGMLVYSIFKKSARPLIVSALVLSATLLLLPRFPDGEGVKLERISSIQARIINWQHSINIFAQYPVFGTGFNTYRYAQKQAGFLDDDKWIKSHSGAGADSSLLFVAATTGIVGLFFYLGFLRHLWGTSRGVFPILTSAIIVHSLFLNTLFYPHYLFFLSTILALFRPVRVEK